MALIDKLNDLGDAVREVSGVEDKMTLDQMSYTLRNLPQPDMSEYATKVEMEEAIAANRYNVGQGLFYDQSRNMIGINMNNAGRLILNNGVLDVNQSNLFNNINSKLIFGEAVEAPIAAGVNTIYEFEPDIPLEEFHQFMNQMIQNPQPLNLIIRMGS